MINFIVILAIKKKKKMSLNRNQIDNFSNHYSRIFNLWEMHAKFRNIQLSMEITISKFLNKYVVAKRESKLLKTKKIDLFVRYRHKKNIFYWENLTKVV